MTFHTVSLVYRGHQNISLSKQTIYMGQEGPKYVIDISECSLRRCLYCGGFVNKWLQKFLQNFESESWGFQEGITLRGRISGSFQILGLQKWVAKFLHLS